MPFSNSAATILYVGDESECLTAFRAELGEASGTSLADVPGAVNQPVVTVETAADGFEAMTWLKENGAGRTVVIVLDFALPVLEAFGFLIGLRAEPALASLPCVLISPRASDPRAQKLGVAAFVERPVDLIRLLAAVRSLLPSA
jgi:CheY-like chemotaxis protein